jgi:hypothetical protein
MKALAVAPVGGKPPTNGKAPVGFTTPALANGSTRGTEQQSLKKKGQPCGRPFDDALILPAYGCGPT